MKSIATFILIYTLILIGFYRCAHRHPYQYYDVYRYESPYQHQNVYDIPDSFKTTRCRHYDLTNTTRCTTY